MSKSKIENRLTEPQHSKEQKADATSVRPAIAKPHVVCSQSQPWMSYEEYIEHNRVYLEKIEAYIKKCKRESG